MNAGTCWGKNTLGPSGRGVERPHDDFTFLPYVLVADDAFLLTTNLMKPYAGESTKGSLKTVYNYKLTEACHIVENSMGVLASYLEYFVSHLISNLLQLKILH
jgi:hypothetical protein